MEGGIESERARGKQRESRREREEEREEEGERGRGGRRVIVNRVPLSISARRRIAAKADARSTLSLARRPLSGACGPGGGPVGQVTHTYAGRLRRFYW